MFSVGILKRFVGIMLCLLALVLVSCGTTPQGAATTKPGSTVQATPTLAPTPTPMPTATPIPASAYPVRLSIPAIGVNAPIEKVGIQADGEMGTPVQNKWNGVGWFVAGTLPGQQGSTVMDGHLDDQNGAPAVFWNLSKLHTGDSVMVIDGSRKALQFHVTRTMAYDYNKAPLQEIFGNGGGKYLNLITCAGSWSYAQNQFQQRLVVYTELN
ncbi:MAG: class F sortase [Ktedonobacteraceae bacterium]